MSKLKVLDLFSGIGGFSLGLERTGGFKTVAFCEIEEFPRKVLAKHWPDVPIAKDIRKLSFNRGTQELIFDGVVIYVGSIDVICGGYPCQPFSVAGKQKGKEDDRHLWPEVDRLLDETGASWFLGENVAGHINLGLDDVLSDLEAKGYTTRAFVIPACAVDAKHRRDRVWIVGNTEHNGASSPKIGRVPDETSNNYSKGQIQASKFKGAGKSKNYVDVANSECFRQQRHRRTKGQVRSEEESYWQTGWSFDDCRWLPEPDVGRVVDGVSDDLEQELSGYGNSVVPYIPNIIGHAVIEAERNAL